MINTLKSNNNFIIESLKIFLEDPREASKTLFFILEKEKVEIFQLFCYSSNGTYMEEV